MSADFFNSLVKEKRYSEAYMALMKGYEASPGIEEEVRMFVEGYVALDGLPVRIEMFAA